jgi:ABC-type amino acid transport substrate-binding protein
VDGRPRPLAAIILVAALGFAADARAACPPGRARGERGDALRVGFAPAAPFAMPAGSDGVVRGFAVELLRRVAAREGWTLELIELSPKTLRARVADCELDVGVAGVPASAALAASVDFSRPYFSTVTTAVVHAGDVGRAGRVEGSAGGRMARAAVRGLVWGLAALALLGLASWMLNAASRRRGTYGLRWRRADAAVSGPLAGLRWLWRSTTGRVLAGLWVAVGLVLGTAGHSADAMQSLLIGGDALRDLVEKAAHDETLLGERSPDGEHVTCSADATTACFRGFADGTLVAVAGPREVLCAHVVDLALDRVVLRDDLAVPEEYAFLLPPGSQLRVALDRGLLRLHEETARHRTIVPCPGDP